MSPSRRSTVLPGVMSSVRRLDPRMEASVLVSARIRSFYREARTDSGVLAGYVSGTHRQHSWLVA